VALPSSAPPSRPPVAASAQDLNDAEFAELDELLAGVPEPLEPLDVVMLDGFLAALVVQPELIDVERWLPHVFDAGGHRWGEAEPGPEQRRARALILRRHAAINRTLAEFGAFDPLILEPSESAVDLPAASKAEVGADPIANEGGTSANREARPEPVPAAADPIAAALLPWVAGFEFAASIFPGLYEIAEDAVPTTLARLYRFLPADDEIDRATTDVVRLGRTLATLDEAIEEVISCVAELYHLTEPLRYQVETVRREAPKIGRNDPCPCGSARKFKRCHGAA